MRISHIDCQRYFTIVGLFGGAGVGQEELVLEEGGVTGGDDVTREVQVLWRREAFLLGEDLVAEGLGEGVDGAEVDVHHFVAERVGREGVGEVGVGARVLRGRVRLRRVVVLLEVGEFEVGHVADDVFAGEEAHLTSL